MRKVLCVRQGPLSAILITLSSSERYAITLSYHFDLMCQLNLSMQHSDNSLLFRLPDALVLHLADQWLCLKHLVKIDSAFFGCESRSQLKERVFRSPQFTFPALLSGTHYTTANRYLAWISRREIAVKNLQVTSEVAAAFRGYLEKFGGSVLEVVVDSVQSSGPELTETFSMLGTYCTSLRSLKCVDSVLPEAILDLLRTCKTLRHLDLRACEEDWWRLNMYSIEACASAHLKTIRIDRFCELPNATSGILKVCNPSVLQSLSIQRAAESSHTFMSHTLPQLAHLRALSLAYTDTLRDAHLAIIVHSCPQIECLDLTRCHSITDTSALIIARDLPRLRSLAVAHGAGGDALLNALAQYRADTLQVLNTHGCARVTCEGVGAVLRQCHKLHTISFTNEDTHHISELDVALFSRITTLYLYFNVPHNDEIFTPLIQRCRNLQVLKMLYYTNKCQLPLLELGAHNVPHLRTLVLHRDTGAGLGYFRTTPVHNELGPLSELQDTRPELNVRYEEVAFEVTV